MVTNARKVHVTGRKESQKLYRHHTMYPGGLKERKYKDLLANKPDEVSQSIHQPSLLILSYVVLHAPLLDIDHTQSCIWDVA